MKAILCAGFVIASSGVAMTQDNSQSQIENLKEPRITTRKSTRRIEPFTQPSSCNFLAAGSSAYWSILSARLNYSLQQERKRIRFVDYGKTGEVTDFCFHLNA